MTNILEYKIILDIKIADDKLALKFITNEGEIIARCYGECCSSTWIENVELPAGGFPARVFKVDKLDLNKTDERNDEHECISFYGFKITTNKGDIIIDYRNSSNGYYGGDLSWDYDKNISKENWIEIKN